MESCVCRVPPCTREENVAAGVRLRSITTAFARRRLRSPAHRRCSWPERTGTCAHDGCDVLRSGPSEACRAIVRWANALQASDTGLGMGAPNPRTRDK
jgi:hypothetical protein